MIWNTFHSRFLGKSKQKQKQNEKNSGGGKYIWLINLGN